ncbi:MAG: hypothetical protein ACI9DC_000542 [Gammaproteobacteria bacterium]|jgi:hypothetical protein
MLMNRVTRTPCGKVVAVAVMATIAMGKVAFAAGDQGLAELHRVVDRACDCAEGQRSGMAAALVCTPGPREFGRLKVANRDAWDDAARSRAEDLEMVIQVCLSNALSAQGAREQLGQRPVRADGSVPAVYWKSIASDDLRPGISSLVRVSRSSGQSSTGIVLTHRGGTIGLRRARRDGGGIEQIAVQDIDRAWVMIVNEVNPPPQ